MTPSVANGPGHSPDRQGRSPDEQHGMQPSVILRGLATVVLVWIAALILGAGTASASTIPLRHGTTVTAVAEPFCFEMP